MNLKEHLINCFLEEREIIEELLYIDNNIQHTSLTYEQLLNEINDIEVNDKQIISNQCVAITDGEFKTVFKILMVLPYLNTLWVDRTSLGINKYLVSRANEFYQEERINIDITKDYFKYKDSKYPIIISGFDTFVEEMSQEFGDAVIID